MAAFLRFMRVLRLFFRRIFAKRNAVAVPLSPEVIQRRKEVLDLKNNGRGLVPIIVEEYNEERFLREMTYVIHGYFTVADIKTHVGERLPEELRGFDLLCNVQGETPVDTDCMEYLYTKYPEDDLHLHLKMTHYRVPIRPGERRKPRLRCRFKHDDST